MSAPTKTASESAIKQQEPSSLSAGSLKPPADGTARLYERYWPPVPKFEGFDAELVAFMSASAEEQQALLARLRGDTERHGRFVHRHLAEVYAHWFGYRDGAFTRHTDDAAEEALFATKIRLERELFDHWSISDAEPKFADQFEAADYLDVVAATNPGVGHPLFAYLRDEATREQLERFLQCELIRNEVVDDEVALLVVGLQGMQKAVAAANLWDEVGRGKLENFHTYWLRRLLEATDGWDALYEYRESHPWFAKFTSNMNAALLTRPSRKMMAYGCFLVFESWVEPHFVNILDGLTRVGILDDEVRIYFTAHVKIDPRHSRELSDGLRLQRPLLSDQEVRDVVHGAHLASAAGRRQFDHMLTYLKSMNGGKPMNREGQSA
ncbi:iron-containing redox enzyme family protein [Solihabitans fulvus]|uniref:Iron-containing redox enzyme family protein n=1 Tax=Solihabitans fulvus TaxID=1892852 RepID=A0A5B2WQB6_9PSEU|nr:iron-containing redox enzyme family protein [Solihabitans fulvus]KAA2253931.1 iron-containing redox enzyme family protein [Solihabitans fulvus]